jgi:hypothetical protein
MCWTHLRLACRVSRQHLVRPGPWSRAYSCPTHPPCLTSWRCLRLHTCPLKCVRPGCQRTAG